MSVSSEEHIVVLGLSAFMYTVPSQEPGHSGIEHSFSIKIAAFLEIELWLDAEMS
jgi:hypothetical protein